MTCKDVMTTNPKCCEPGDTAVRAAQIMKEEDVGPVPVVNSANDKRIVGIVTDRDLAIEVVASGRDPNSTRIEEIMTRRPVACHKDDDAYDAMDAMGRNQVRRIPVVDDHDRIVGIIAQADLARQLDEEDVGEVVEEISQPSRNSLKRTFGGMSSSHNGGPSAAGVLIAAGIGMATGATLMCLFDPARGRNRRERVSNAARTAYDHSADLMNRASKTLGINSGSGRFSRRTSDRRLIGSSEPLGL